MTTTAPDRFAAAPEIAAALQARIDAFAGLAVRPGWRWATAYHFVHDVGRAFQERQEAPLWMHGPMGQCFHNALRVASRNPRRYVYCEGFAHYGIMEVAHAWVLDRQTGALVDPTWTTGTYPAERGQAALGGVQYIGVPFEIAHARAAIRKGTGAVIDDWKRGWPILCNSVPDEAWRPSWYGADGALTSPAEATTALV